MKVREMMTLAPHEQPTALYLGGTCYGTIGKATPYHDFSGKPLFVGDIVKTWSIDDEGEICEHGKNFVVFKKRAFVMGIEACCEENGTFLKKFDLQWFVEKVTDYREVEKYATCNDVEAR